MKQQQKSKGSGKAEAGLPVHGGVVNRTGDWDRDASKAASGTADRGAAGQPSAKKAPKKR